MLCTKLSKETHKRDPEKRPIKRPTTTSIQLHVPVLYVRHCFILCRYLSTETHKKRPRKETQKRDPEKRPRKETQKRDPEKRPRKETQKRDPRLLLYDNFTYLHRIFATASSSPQSEKKPIKETHKTDP